MKTDMNLITVQIDAIIDGVMALDALHGSTQDVERQPVVMGERMTDALRRWVVPVASEVAALTHGKVRLGMTDFTTLLGFELLGEDETGSVGLLENALCHLLLEKAVLGTDPQRAAAARKTACGCLEFLAGLIDEDCISQAPGFRESHWD